MLWVKNQKNWVNCSLWAHSGARGSPVRFRRASGVASRTGKPRRNTYANERRDGTTGEQCVGENGDLATVCGGRNLVRFVGVARVGDTVRITEVQEPVQWCRRDWAAAGQVRGPERRKKARINDVHIGWWR